MVLRCSRLLCDVVCFFTRNYLKTLSVMLYYQFVVDFPF